MYIHSPMLGMNTAPSPSFRHSGATAAIIGGGPAGLMAAQVLNAAGVDVTVYDAKASVGRKFLLAGKGGLNLTHSEPLPRFIQRYGTAAPQIRQWLGRFGPEALRDWARDLGFETFVGSSGRIFPEDMKAGPLLRTWLRSLRDAGVTFRVQHRLTDLDGRDGLVFANPGGEYRTRAAITVLALGGGSWARLGSDGDWVELLHRHGIGIAPLRPTNCGFELDWSPIFTSRFEGHPLKTIAARPRGSLHWRRGELLITRHGIEGSLVYALSARLREMIERDGKAILELDLMPDHAITRLEAALSQARHKRSHSEFWRRKLGLNSTRIGLLHEFLPPDRYDNPNHIARMLKSLPLTLLRTRPLDEAISTAGGVRLGAVNARLMLQNRPGTFVAGEMLDWEAPTGGYLLTAVMASGVVAAEGALAWWQERTHAL